MMVTTHILLGVVVGSIASLLVPTNPSALAIAGAVGGLFPDLDMVLTHRKSLHFPVVYPVIALVSIAVAGVSNAGAVLLIAVGTAAAALHSLMDTLGGGKEMRPWRRTDDRAVFNHVTGQWIRARRVFYDGSGPDFLLATSSGAIAVWALPSASDGPILLLLACSLLYVLARRSVTRWIPERYATFSSYVQAKLRAASGERNDSSD